MEKQCASLLFMIRPEQFRMNEQTVSNNSFQQSTRLSGDEIADKALDEFDYFVDLLREKGIRVIVAQPADGSGTPDQVFPNNWVSFHQDGRVAIYPMFAANRRKERREELIWGLSNEGGLEVEEIIDFTEFEEHKKYLEGTGSLVLDHKNRIAYAAISPRTDLRAVELFCEVFGYNPVTFSAHHGDSAIYHTNVMLSIGESLAIIADQSIKDAGERKKVTESLINSQKEIVFLSEEQMNNFAANVLMVRNEEGTYYLIMSERAYHSYTPEQLDVLKKHAQIVYAPLSTIEQLGGGSARCMLAEVFLPKL
jgi:hypothetical protein